MYLTASDLQAIERARYQLSALQVEVQLLRLELIHKANFDPNQPRVPRGHPRGGRWSRVGGSETSRRVGAAEDTRPAEPTDRAGTETTTLPGNRQLVRDRTGTEPWEVYVDTLRPNGSVAERVVINRDGSAIRSEFSITPELTGWDESHTVIGAGGELATFQNLGKTQTILDATGEVIQVASWTNSGPEIEYLRPDLGFGRPSLTGNPGAGDVAILGLGLGLYAWFASTATQGQRPVFAFRAREFQRQGATAPLYVGRLEREEVEPVCARMEDVQGWTNDVVDAAKLKGPYPSAAAYGTAVHVRLKEIIVAQNDPLLRAEASYFPTREGRYGQLGTIRVDVLDSTRESTLRTVCVYDIKTGNEVLDRKRSKEIAARVLAAFPDTQRIIVVEIRPQG